MATKPLIYENPAFIAALAGFVNPHCTENVKHIIPEMKLCGLCPNVYIHVSGSDLYIPTIGIIWNLIYCVTELSSQLQ